MAQPSGKKIVRSSSAPKSTPGSRRPPEQAGPTFVPTPEAKKQATTFRLIALALWVLAIAGELFAIFWVLKHPPINMVLLTILMVVVGALTIGGSLLWKRANTHVCSAVPEVNKESEDGQTYEGSAADAHGAGKQRLTMKWQSEAVSYCGYTQDQVSAVADASSDTEGTPEPAPTRIPTE